jgi:hypothetical protein
MPAPAEDPDFLLSKKLNLAKNTTFRTVMNKSRGIFLTYKTETPILIA